MTGATASSRLRAMVTPANTACAATAVSSNRYGSGASSPSSQESSPSVTTASTTRWCPMTSASSSSETVVRSRSP